MDAHHVFPQAQRFQKYWQNAGINIHDPKNLVWWKSSPHRSAASAYNKAWDSFFRETRNPNKQQIIDFGNNLMRNYGF